MIFPALPPHATPCDVAVVIPTILRPTLQRAVESVFRQRFAGTIQILIGVDVAQGDPRQLDALHAIAPDHCRVTLLDPGYSTSARHGGMHKAHDGGALRTILSYLAHSRYVAYLDDDNWWGPDHLSTLIQAVRGHDWAWSLRWYVDDQSTLPICVDRWDSVGPGQGCYREKFGGWVDPNSLLIDKLACEPALRLWCQSLPGDRDARTGDRIVFDWLRRHGRAAGTGRATAYYTLNPKDGMHPQRLKWIAETLTAE